MRSVLVRASLGIAVLVLAGRAATAPGAGQQAAAGSLAQRLERVLEEPSRQGFALTALVSVDGREIIRSGFGRLGPGGPRAGVSTLFNIASITKSFTAVAVLRLKEKGLLDLEDRLPKFFPGVPEEKAPITLRDLLVHTSGLGQDYSADGIAERDKAVAAILAGKGKFPPGAGFSYSNENYELLAAVIEIVSGEPYERFLRTNVLSKCGMTATRFWDETSGLPAGAVAPLTRPLDAAVLGRNWGYIGSGGVYSNVVDLERWFRALAGGRLLEPRTLEWMWTPQRREGETGIALGWFVSKATDGSPEIWTRGSEDWGHNGVLRWFPARRALVIVQSNSGEGGDKNVTANRAVSDALVRVLFESGAR